MCEYAICLEKVCFSYAHVAVLRDLSLQVRTGEHIAVTGDSGCGKSTLLRLLAGLYPPESGYVSVAGERLPERIRARVAPVMQRSSLFPLSIRDNITCGHDIPEERLREACRNAGLDAWLRGLPEGLDTSVGERGGQVSGGQAQRIQIARALCKDAPVLLLDEPVSALDRETGSAVLRALHGMTENRTVIHVTHHPETLDDGYRIFRLEEGRLLHA